jgi:hypothetical protein
MRAFCLHPLVQNGLLQPNPDILSSYLVAEEYSIAANSYLCRSENDTMSIAKLRKRLGDNLSQEAAFMLLADKVQNQKDFRLHHWFSHERRFQLDRYFEIWIDTLRSFYIGWHR